MVIRVSAEGNVQIWNSLCLDHLRGSSFVNDVSFQNLGQSGSLHFTEVWSCRSKDALGDLKIRVSVCNHGRRQATVPRTILERKQQND